LAVPQNPKRDTIGFGEGLRGKGTRRLASGKHFSCPQKNGLIPIKEGGIGIVGGGYHPEAFLHERSDHRKHAVLVGRIKVGVGLIEEEEGCFLGQGPGDEDEPLLPTA
jgi:hypothetical protein